MAAASLLAVNQSPSDSDIDAAMSNLCRCATYPRIRAGIHRAARSLVVLPAEPQVLQDDGAGADPSIEAAPNGADK
jgi:xanthine dehydrogenase iron-sulfur cluster and FAD-binding subunit A